MSQPLRLNQPELAFPVERPAPPPWASDIVAGSSGRFGVPAKGWAVLVLVDRLSRKTGFCYMTQRRMAPQIGVKPRQLRKYLSMLAAQGHLKIRHPRGLAPEMWVASWPGPVAAAEAKPAGPRLAQAGEGGGTGVPRGVALECHPGGGTLVPPNIQLQTNEAREPAGALLRKIKNQYWKPSRFSKLDATRQLSDAVRLGLVLFTTHERRRRRLVKVTHNASYATLFLTDESNPEAPPAEVRVLAGQIGDNPYWR